MPATAQEDRPHGADVAVPFTALAAVLADGVALLDRTGTIVQANARLAELAARPVPRLVGVRLADLVIAADGVRVDGAVQAAIGRPASLLAELHSASGPCAVCITLAPCGDAHAVAVIAPRSVPPLPDPRLSLAAAVVDHAPAAIVACDVAGRVLFANAAAVTLAGEALVGRPFEQVVPLQGCPALPRALRGRPTPPTRARLAGSAGGVDVLVAAWPLARLHREAIGCVVALLEVGALEPLRTAEAPAPPEAAVRAAALERALVDRTTELQRAMERLRRVERLASIGMLAAGVAHEINNPLNAILMASRYARSYPNEVEAAEALAIVAAEAQRGAEVVHSMLRFVKHERGERHAADLNDVVRQACDLARAYVRRAQLSLHFELQALPAVALNSVEITQVVVNLLKNAGEAAPARAITVRVSTRHEPREAGVYLTFEDDGPGIAPDDLPHLFDPFTPARPRGGGGTGLGLGICQAIVAEHGGWIDAHSEPGCGARFRIFLPCATGGGAAGGGAAAEA